MIDYDDLDDARDAVLRLSRRRLPGVRALDTDTPQVKAGLLVVEFDVPDAIRFAKWVTAANLHRIAVAKKTYAVDLFTACYASGMCIGAMAERRQHAD
jgi:hypothetical protein